MYLKKPAHYIKFIVFEILYYILHYVLYFTQSHITY